jgi:hypothetical protein
MLIFSASKTKSILKKFANHNKRTLKSIHLILLFLFNVIFDEVIIPI